MFLAQPYRIDGTGRTATLPDAHQHARTMIEAILFTAPGERVNRPEFGSGIYEMLFDANSEALETAADFLIRSSLQQHLGDVVSIDALSLRRDGGVLEITLTYGLIGSQDRVTEQFTHEV